MDKIIFLSIDECGRMEDYHFHISGDFFNEGEDLFQQLKEGEDGEFISFTDMDGHHHIYNCMNIICVHIVDDQEDHDETDQGYHSN